MRKVSVTEIENAVEALFIKANYVLPESVCKAVSEARKCESDERAGEILKKLEINAETAKEGVYPICQDTGMAVVFVEIGNEVHIEGGVLPEAVNRGVARAYDKGYLRKSVVAEPFFNPCEYGQQHSGGYIHGYCTRRQD